MKVEEGHRIVNEHIKNLLLDILREAEYPIKCSCIKEIIRKFYPGTFGLEGFPRALRELREEGYDIRAVRRGKKEGSLYLSKTCQLDRPYFAKMRDVSLPLLITADWHVGSKGFSRVACKELIKDATTYKTKDILILGDLVQGLGIYQKELKDLALTDVDAQMDLTEELLREFPKDTRIHCVMGGHEEVMKGKRQVGFDILRALSVRVKNFFYYGDRMDLSVNKKYSLTAFHSTGGITTTSLSKAERVWRELEVKPDILAMGHNHRLYMISKGEKIILEVGTLQRETSLISQRGMPSQLGWWILKRFNKQEVDITKRTPKSV